MFAERAIGSAVGASIRCGNMKRREKCKIQLADLAGLKGGDESVLAVFCAIVLLYFRMKLQY